MFQSTHPHGVRHDHPEATPLECWFQSTHPHGVRLLLRTSCARCSMFQSTHPHGVRHKTLWVSCFLNYVSIHAPTRGATSQFLRYFALSSCFNPRTHTGCDVFSDEYLLAFIKFQSTHPHGVRPDFVEVHVLWKSFNPRTHTGCDVTNPTSSPFKSEFQSTHPHGVRRPRFPCSIGIRASFNPRTHTGCDSLTSIL